jgi:hypothetical protein
MEKVIITKVGEDSPAPAPKSILKKGSARKTQRTYPKGILKVADPAKAPPMRKQTRKQTVKLITEKGSKKYRKTLKRKLSKLSDAKVRSLVEKNGLLKNKQTPPALMRDMLEGAVVSGFISLD